MSDKKFNIELVTLEEITIRSATLENHGEQTSIDLSDLDIVFRYEMNPGISLRGNRVQITAEYEIGAAKPGTDKSEIKSKYCIAFLFEVQNLSELATRDDRLGLSVDGEMLTSLLNITYSTSRGILYTRFLGTPLQGIILPIIPTNELFESPSAIKPILTK